MWALSHTDAVDHGLNNAFFKERGLVSLVALHRRTRQDIVAPTQPQPALEWG